MKLPVALLILGLCSACSHRDPKPDRPALTKKSNAARVKTSGVRTPETVKAYPVGRYRDPHDPDVMHERHTIYRREQSADWNFLPDAPYALPLGPITARSNPTASYYVTADREQMTGQQRAYAAALLEQNRALKKRLETDAENGERVQSLEREIEQLKRQLDAANAPEPADPPTYPSKPSAAETWDDFSHVDPPLPAWESSASRAAVPHPSSALAARRLSPALSNTQTP